METIGLADEAKTELWSIYACCSCILVLKMMSITWFTGQIRHAKQVIHSEEDRMWMKPPNIILCPSGDGHPDVERIRSAHRWDLEIVFPYLIITPIWLCTSPWLSLAKIILPCFTVVSICYTLAHMEIMVVHMHSKEILTFFAFFILLFMSISSLLYYV